MQLALVNSILTYFLHIVKIERAVDALALFDTSLCLCNSYKKSHVAAHLTFNVWPLLSIASNYSLLTIKCFLFLPSS